MYISIDIETTGLDFDNDQVLELAAVAWKDDGPVEAQPYFNAIFQRDKIIGHPYALNMNAALIEKLSRNEGEKEGIVMSNFCDWLRGQGVTKENKVFPLGKNYGSFDLQFLKKLVYWPKHLFKHRALDVGSCYATKEGIPDLFSIQKENNLPEITGKPHEALYDARLALDEFRVYLSNKDGAWVLTRSGEFEILGIYNDYTVANEAAHACHTPGEMSLRYYEFNSFKPGT